MLKNDEKVIVAIKQNAGVFLKSLGYTLLILVVMLAIIYFFGFGTFIKWISLVAFLVVIFMLSREYKKWDKTYYLITKKRIIAYEQKGWFKNG